MAPEGFSDFFLASAGTGGAFVGLLFVAISIGPARTFDDREAVGWLRQQLAEAALLTLIDGFVVSSVALIPEVSPGWTALATGTLGAALAGRLVRWFARAHRHQSSGRMHWSHVLRIGLQSSIAIVVFVAEAALGLVILLRPSEREAFVWLAVIIVMLYAMALFRAWTLLGNPKRGLSGWLNPLHDEMLRSASVRDVLSAKPRPRS